MDFLAVGALFFLVVVAISVGIELQERYLGEGGADGEERGFRLLPRRNYRQLHGENYAAPLLPAVPPGKFQVKRQEQANRCEICHQQDRFDLTTGHCSRCNHQTH